MNNRIFILLIVVFCASFAHGQTTNNDKAKKLYKEALENYKNESFTQSIIKLNEAEKLLGSTNLTIQYLKIKNHHGLKNYDKAQEEIEMFLSLNPADDEILSEILKIKKDIIIRVNETKKENEAIKEKQDWVKATKLNKKDKYEQYLNDFPNGLHGDEAKHKVFYFNLFNEAITQGSLISIIMSDGYKKLGMDEKHEIFKYYLQLDKVELVTVMLNSDKILYNFILTEKSDEITELCITKNLNKCLNELLTNKIQDRLSQENKLKTDNYFYSLAISDNTLLEKYCDFFVNGIHYNEAKELLGKFYLKSARNSFVLGKYATSCEYYQKYLNEFPGRPDAAGVKTNYSIAYYFNAKTQNSIEQLEKYVTDYPNGEYVPEAKKQIKEIHSANVDHFFGYQHSFISSLPFAYSFNINSPIGINILEVYDEDFGFYIFTKFKVSRFWYGKPVDITVQPNGSFVDNAGRTDNINNYKILTTKRNFFIGGGITRHVVSRFWLHSGIGFGSEKTIHYIEGGSYFTINSMDYRKYYLLTETGITACITRRISIRLGMVGLSFKDWSPSFGIAWNYRN